MKNRYLFLISLIFLSLNIFAQSTFEENGIVYMEDPGHPDKMQVYVMQKKSPLLYPGQSAYTGDIIIPAQIEHDLDTYDVVALGHLAFMNCNITSLDIQAPITSIDHNMIYSTTLKKLRLPDTLKILRGLEAPNLEEVYFGEGLQDLNDSPSLFYFTGNQKRDFHCPWKNLPTPPRIHIVYDSANPTINFYVPKGMRNEYISQWNLAEINGVNVIEE